MCSHGVGEVNISWLLHTADEAYALREGNGVGKRLGEGAVAWKLEDSILAELKGTEVFLVIGEASFRGGDHIVHVVSVGGDVINLNRDGVYSALVHLTLHIIAG